MLREGQASSLRSEVLREDPRPAEGKYTIPQSMVVEYFLGDHLGSTSITTDTAGAKVSEMRYKPFGEVRDFSLGEVRTLAQHRV